MSIPDVPRLSVLPALSVTGPPTLEIMMPPQLASTPSATAFAPVTVESHLARSSGPGITPPSQLVVRLRLSVLFVLVIVPAFRHATLARIARQVKEILMGWVFMG